MALRIDSSGQNIRNVTASRTPTASQMAIGSAYGNYYAPEVARRLGTSSTPAPEPAPEPTYYGGGYSAPAPAMPTQADALQTPEYIMTQQQLANALNLFKAQQAADRQRYDVNYEQALRNLGWIPEATDVGGMASKGKWDTGELLTSQGKQTTSGKTFTDLLNDYASRGLSQSGMFAVARNAAQNQLNEQLSSAEKARAGYLQDLQNKQNQMLAEQEAKRQEALTMVMQNLRDQYLSQSGVA